MVKESDLNRPVSKEETQKFLMLIKKSEYKVIKQQTPAKISILSLLKSSTEHRNTLLEVLKQAFVSWDITMNNMNNIIGNIIASNSITFMDDEISQEDTSHTKVRSYFN